MSSAVGTPPPGSASFQPVSQNEHNAPPVSSSNTHPHFDPHLPIPPSVEVLPASPPPAASVNAAQNTGTMGFSADADTRNTYPAQGQDADANMTVEGEFALNIMAEETLVEGDAEEEDLARKVSHVKGPSSSSFALPSREYPLERSLDAPSSTQPGSAEGERGTTTTATTPTWDPLHTLAQETTKSEGGHAYHDKDNTVIVEEEEDGIMDSKGRSLFPDETEETPPTTPGGIVRPSPVGSRRASHLRLDLKPPSPQPWEHIDPPLDNNLKSIAGYYSPGTTKFRTLQSAGGPRPLIPKSSYYFGPPAPDSAYGTAPTGQIGVHHPREILRVERDYTGGELIQFAPIYPLELEGRITPTQFLESINAMNEILISAHSLRHSFLDNVLAVFSLQISTLFITPHWEKASPFELERLRSLIDDLNAEIYNPVGLNILWPRDVAFLYLEIEYY